jgi:hypothetical protein
MRVLSTSIAVALTAAAPALSAQETTTTANLGVLDTVVVLGTSRQAM